MAPQGSARDVNIVRGLEGLAGVVGPIGGRENG
jgi:hypothetical protein